MTNLEAHWDFVNHRPATKQEKGSQNHIKLYPNTGGNVNQVTNRKEKHSLFE